jgi:hypothetical protein
MEYRVKIIRKVESHIDLYVEAGTEAAAVILAEYAADELDKAFDLVVRQPADTSMVTVGRIDGVAEAEWSHEADPTDVEEL